MKRLLPLLALCLLSAPAQGQIITEIMYNPSSTPEATWEYIEVYNNTAASINLAGWVVVDAIESPASSNVTGGTLAPGGTVAFFYALDAGTQPLMEAAWGETCFVPVNPWGALNNNTASGTGVADTPCIYATHADFLAGSAIDCVAYDDSTPWPSDDNASSIYLTNSTLDNDLGANWARSAEGVAGADSSAAAGNSQTKNVGSPCTPPPDIVVLPIELVSFTAQPLRDDATRLEWITATETDNSGFEILHRAKRSAAFSRIGFVAGAGSSTTESQYSYVVDGLETGTHEFKLRQIDHDGTSTYSPVVRAILDLAGTHEVAAAYPNPVGLRSEINIVVSSDQQVRVEVVDLTGRVVDRPFQSLIQANSRTSVQLDVSNLPNGTYFYRTTGETFTETRSLIVVR